jgi:hypothetical protein
MTLIATRAVSRQVRSQLASSTSVVPARARARRARTTTHALPNAAIAIASFPTPAGAAAATSVRTASSSWEQLAACAMIAFFLVLALFG